ncbi:MAG: flagellar basal-body MS-ring/collar protein FliF [Vampirovibrionales bacterium]
MNALQQFGQAFVQRFSTLTPVQRTVLGTLLLAMILIIALVAYKSNDNWDVLYSNLSVPDASATVAKLKELNKPYKLADGGTTILVPREAKSEMVLETASELTSTEPISLAKIPPVLQGEVQKEWLKKFNTDMIANTLTSIHGIRQAKVIISQPEESVFSENDEPIRASVMLIVDPGFRLKEKQVSTIRALVAHGVPGLAAENVVLSDNFGNTLDENPQGAGSMPTRETRKAKQEKELKQKLMDLLVPMVGVDNAVVSVSVDMNFDQARAKIKNVEPLVKNEKEATGLIVSQQLQSEEYSGNKRVEGGGAGTESNSAPSYQSQDKNKEGDKNYKSQKQTTNYAHSETEKEVIYASGVTERMTVAVVLNKVLTTQETQEIKEMIASAVGLKAERGDTVDVKGFQFSESPNKKQSELASLFKEGQQQGLWLQGGYLLVLLALGGGALFALMNAFKKPIAVAQAELIYDDEGRPLPPVMYDEDGNPITVDMLEEDSDGNIIAPENKPLYDQQGRLVRLGELSRADLRLPEVTYTQGPEIDFMKESITNFIQRNVSMASKILVVYMNDDD